MVIVPGDVAAQTVEHAMLRHPILTDRPVSRPTDEALAKAVDLVAARQEDRHPRRGGHAPGA